MKLIGISDAHITSKIPRGRIGNPLKDAKKKLLFVFEYANKIGADILFAGDLFNSPRDILALFMFLSVTSKFPKVKVFAVFGQHDLYMRNKDVVTNMGILSKSGVVTVLDHNPYLYRYTEKGKKDIHLYGCSWGAKIPKIINNKISNVLVIHAPIYHQEIFPGQKYSPTKQFVKKNKNFSFIIVGDIHRQFTYEYENTIIANTGPMMRLEASEYIMNHRPNFVVYDTLKKVVETVYIQCKHSTEVLSETTNKEVISGNYTGISDAFISESEIDDINIIAVVKELLALSKNKGAAKVLSEIMGRDEINEI